MDSGREISDNRPPVSKLYLWDHSAVKRIIHNEIYKGTVVNHKTLNSRINHIRKSLLESEWYKNDDLVSPIISPEMWDKVKTIADERKKKYVRSSYGSKYHRYAGLIKCGNCGSHFVCRTNRNKNPGTKCYYVCNAYHRYGKTQCTPHIIYEYELDELIYEEILSLRTQAESVYENIERDVKGWMRQKKTVEGRLILLTDRLERRKADQKEILLERIRDREHSEVYTEMLTVCESKIKDISSEIISIKNYKEAIRKRKSEIKKTVDLIDSMFRTVLSATPICACWLMTL